MKTRKLCNYPSDVPKEDHWAILESTSVHIPGDQRSRDYPGHGYPASTENYMLYYSYLNEDEWKAAIHDLMTSKYSKPLFQALVVKTVSVKTTVSVEIK